MLKIIPFLNELAQHNHKSWFDENRNSYQEARAELLDFVENLLKQLSKANPWMLALKPNTCLFRINRDVRFSKNKNPYKTHAGIYMAPGGRNSGNAGFYIHIEPSKSFIGGGVYGPEPNVLKAIRREIYFNAAAFKQIVLNEGFQKTFGQLMDERLKRPPKGFPADFTDMECSNISILLYHIRFQMMILVLISFLELSDIFKFFYEQLNFYYFIFIYPPSMTSWYIILPMSSYIIIKIY
jgi:uncharacterized protein (TIGR02453 family)